MIDIENKVTNYEYVYVDFVSPLEPKQILSCIEKQHSDAAITSIEDGVFITKNNYMIFLKQEEVKSFLWQKRYVYQLESQFVTLEKTPDNFVCIPFPEDYLEIEGAYEPEMNISCDLETLKNFYQHFTNVDILENEIIIKKDEIIKIRVKNGKVIITFE